MMEEEEEALDVFSGPACCRWGVQQQKRALIYFRKVVCVSHSFFVWEMALESWNIRYSLRNNGMVCNLPKRESGLSLPFSVFLGL